MPVYNYNARASSGEMVQGIQEAESERLAVTALQNRGLLVIKLASLGSASAPSRRRKLRRRRIRSEDTLFFLDQLAMLLEAGIPLVRSLEIIALLTESQRMNEVIGAIISNIRAGSTLKDSMARHPKHFPKLWLFLVEAGETSGSVPMVLKELAKNVKSNHLLMKKIISALIYPCILVICSVGVLLLFMLRIIPIFQKIFSQFNAKLPPLTMAIINISTVIQHYIFFIAFMAIGLFFLSKKYISTSVGRRQLDRLLLLVPVLGEGLNDFIHARICIILSTLIKSGVNLIQSLEIASRAAGNSVFENAFLAATKGIQRGQTLSASLQTDPIFSPMFIQLVTIGEESGSLPAMISKASEFYAERVDTLSTRIGILVEPLVLIIVGAFVGIIAYALFVPMFSLSEAIH